MVFILLVLCPLILYQLAIHVGDINALMCVFAKILSNFSPTNTFCYTVVYVCVFYYHVLLPPESTSDPTTVIVAVVFPVIFVIIVILCICLTYRQKHWFKCGKDHPRKKEISESMDYNDNDKKPGKWSKHKCCTL